MPQFRIGHALQRPVVTGCPDCNFRHRPAMAGGKVVEHNHAFTGIDQVVDHLAADLTGAASNKDRAAMHPVCTLNSSSRYCQLHVVLPAVTLQQRKQYYRESQFFAGLFGIPKECLPQDWAGFADYFPETVQSQF
jgi:hypothetical protein